MRSLKFLLLGVFILLGQLSFSSTCPQNQTCYENPDYEGYQFLAVTGSEARYVYYASYPHYASYPQYASYASYPSKIMKSRAQKVCEFLGHKSVAFAKAGQYTWDSLLEVGKSGYAEVVNASYYPNTSFEKLNCK